MSDAEVKLFTYCLLRVKPLGKDRGKFQDSAESVGSDLGWDRRKVYLTIKKLEVYIDVEYPKNRHGLIKFEIKNYKGSGDFYRSKKTDSKVDSKTDSRRTVDGQYTDSRRTVTDAKMGNINNLQSPNNLDNLDNIDNNNNNTLWKKNFSVYKQECNDNLESLLSDKNWIIERQNYHPNLNIKLTLQKAWSDYWATEAGWKNKKSKRSKTIDWKATANNSLSQRINQVWLKKEEREEMETITMTEAEAKEKGYI